jgi:hypothetical protein
MKRMIPAATACVLALALGTAVASGDPKPPKPNNVAAKQCQAEKHADPAAFRATYGPKHAMQTCKRIHREEAEAAVANASQECRAEQEADPALFEQTYGTNHNGSNAFGKCVSGKVKEHNDEEVAEFQNAAAECRAERNADPALFAETYGTNHNNRNAFGKCVSQHVREEAPAPTT